MLNFKQIKNGTLSNTMVKRTLVRLKIKTIWDVWLKISDEQFIILAMKYFWQQRITKSNSKVVLYKMNFPGQPINNQRIYKYNKSFLVHQMISLEEIIPPVFDTMRQ